MQTMTEKIHGLLTKFDTAVLVTHGRDSNPRARPMGIAKISESNELWFFTGRDSEKAHELRDDEQVLLVFQKDHSAYVSLVGRASLVSDRSAIAELWKSSYKTWFPGGVDDPNLLLIRVHGQEVEYWDNTGFNSVKYLFETARAYITGNKPNVTEPEQHAHVAMK
ncbi:MAG TPA: pyridoxamine 5'-phosphate oxidase family protein [Verrucomicrobiae bacterium]|jgi:general stress protein 26|nr:pyridoxamine 5'-phosphate oxidase family protein [Verrucomicrobiae bacterium]